MDVLIWKQASLRCTRSHDAIFSHDKKWVRPEHVAWWHSGIGVGEGVRVSGGYSHHYHHPLLMEEVAMPGCTITGLDYEHHHVKSGFKQQMM